MTEASKDTQRTTAAAKMIVDGRDLHVDGAAILVTLEQLVAVVMLATQRDERSAALMFNEGLVPGVEARLALHAHRK